MNANVEEVKQRSNATWYKITWATTIPSGEFLALETDTVDWYMGGSITITDLADENASPSRVHNEPTANPTKPGLEIPPERFALDPTEIQWISRDGGIRMLIINPFAARVRPIIRSVDLVPT